MSQQHRVLLILQRALRVTHYRQGDERPGDKKCTGIEAQRQDILKAAVAMFAASGTAAVSVSAICKQAGVFRDTFYRCYDNKDHAYEVIDRAFNRVAASMQRWCHVRVHRAVQNVNDQKMDPLAAVNEAVAARMLTDLSNSLPSHITVLAFRAASAAGLLATTKPIFNTIITNVPGPQVPLYMSGAKLVRSLGAGPCMDNLGIFHPVTSYNGMISVSFQACRVMMPDPQFYEDCLRSSFEELCAAVPTGRPKRKAAGKSIH